MQVNRTSISYEPLSEGQISDIQRHIHQFVEGALQEIPVRSKPHANDCQYTNALFNLHEEWYASIENAARYVACVKQICNLWDYCKSMIKSVNNTCTGLELYLHSLVTVCIQQRQSFQSKCFNFLFTNFIVFRL